MRCIQAMLPGGSAGISVIGPIALMLGCSTGPALARHTAEILRNPDGNGAVVTVVVMDTGIRESQCAALIDHYRAKAQPRGAVMVVAAPDSSSLCDQLFPDSGGPHFEDVVIDPVRARCKSVAEQDLLYRASLLHTQQEQDKWLALRDAGRLTNEAFLDSVRGTPSPRPSDRAWYDEHCWQGKPR